MDLKLLDEMKFRRMEYEKSGGRSYWLEQFALNEHKTMDQALRVFLENELIPEDKRQRAVDFLKQKS